MLSFRLLYWKTLTNTVDLELNLIFQITSHVSECLSMCVSLRASREVINHHLISCLHFPAIVANISLLPRADMITHGCDPVPLLSTAAAD